MKLTVEKFLIPFLSPLTIDGIEQASREGYYLIGDDKYFGELSPLPGLNSESLNDAYSQLTELLPRFANLELATSNFKLDVELFDLLKLDGFSKLYPSVQFCIESLLLNYAIDLKLVSRPSEIRMNSLLIPDGESIDTQIQSWRDQKIDTVKIKIGRQDLGTDINLINEIISKTSNTLKLRLDGNRSFTKDSLAKLLMEIDLSRVEYLEEPLINIEEWEEISKIFNVSIALDESLLEEKKIATNCSAWVLKPALHGALSNSIRLIKEANDKNIYCVVSSIFHTSYGIESLKVIASFQNSLKETDHGLDTLKYFSS
jgi:o-succinylbenzoate synthase